MSSPLEDIQRTLPQYLSPQSTSQLAEAIKRFPDRIQYYGGAPDAGVWQGDVYSEVRGVRLAADGPTHHRQRFMTISNTCDVAEENPRQFDMHVCLAPITTVKKFAAMLLVNGLAENRVNSIIDAIARQQVTNVFFLPQGGGGPAESLIVFLDALQSQNIEVFRSDADKRRDFSLSQVGWYLLLVKLSIHFCRAFEQQERQPPVEERAAPQEISRIRSWLERVTSAWKAFTQ